MSVITYELRKHGSYVNEYTLKCEIDRRNNIMWDLDLESLKQMTIPNEEQSDTRMMANVTQSENSDQTLRCIFPKIKSNPRNRNDYKLLFAFQWQTNAYICIKAAIQHRTTGKIAIISAQNSVPTEKHFHSEQEGWYVHGMAAIAPRMFWKAFHDEKI